MIHVCVWLGGDEVITCVDPKETNTETKINYHTRKSYLLSKDIHKYILHEKIHRSPNCGCNGTTTYEFEMYKQNGETLKIGFRQNENTKLIHLHGYDNIKLMVWRWVFERGGGGGGGDRTKNKSYQNLYDHGT